MVRISSMAGKLCALGKSRCLFSVVSPLDIFKSSVLGHFFYLEMTVYNTSASITGS